MSEEREGESGGPLTGGCGCGAVRWSLSEPPILAHNCFCTRCQRRSGTAASINAMTAPGSLTFTAGEEALEAWTPDEGWHKYFCGECGSALFSCHPTDPGLVSMRMGSFDSDPGIRPSFHQFTAYAAAWGPVPDDGLPRFEQRRPAGE
jgi:hypothetical protein